MKHLKLLIALLFVLLLPPVAAQEKMVTNAVADPVYAFATGGSVDSTSVAVMILDLKTGKTVGSYRSDRPMVPASVMKCVTTATLLNEVGQNWKYKTPVYVTGRVRDGILEGNLEVEASGDPSINTRHEPGSDDIVAEIIAALRREKIDTIRGSIIIDEDRFAGPAVNPTWASGDLSQAYGTGTHGFNFQDNASGGASVKNPSGVFLNQLRAAMSRAGIMVEGRKVEGGRRKLLMTHHSQTVDEIMRSCMMRSDNQFAEGMMRTISDVAGQDGSTARGTDFVMNYWKKKHLPTDSVRIVDGSGLSRSNRLTAQFLAGVLTKMAKNPHYASFFPLAGQEGTLRKFLAGTRLEGYLAMKTGSMNGIQSYAGYKLNDDYEPTHVIVVMINNMADRARARAGIQKMLEQLF